jgi:hypothetical protein
MHDRNGTPLEVGDSVTCWLPAIDEQQSVEVPAVVLGSDGDKVRVAVPLSLPTSTVAPYVVAAFDQMTAAGRNTGSPSGTLPTLVTSDTIELID